MPATARATLLPFLLFATGSVSRCELSTESGTSELHISGTVRFLEAEGGCWRLEGDDGRRYELHPNQAPPAVLRDGVRVRVIAYPSEDAVGVCRSALPVDVRRVDSVDVA
jgi:hypothetical protein